MTPEPPSSLRTLGRALVLGLLLTGAGAEFLASHRDGALAMPPGAIPPAAGRFAELRQDFPIPQIDTYEYEPSASTRALSTAHISLDGAIPRRWYSYVPPSEGRLPLVILFHGAGRDGLSLIEMWKDTALRHGVVLVAPNSLGGSWSLDDPSPQFILGLVGSMASSHQIDPERIYLFGHSSGAGYAMVLLNRFQGPWRAAALHAGYAPPHLLAPPRMARPYRLYIGENEQIFSVDTARQTGRSLAAFGHDNDLVVIPRHDHWFYGIGPRIAEDAWTWLSAR